jgi:hypothetical protein
MAAASWIYAHQRWCDYDRDRYKGIAMDRHVKVWNSATCNFPYYNKSYLILPIHIYFNILVLRFNFQQTIDPFEQLRTITVNEALPLPKFIY